MADGDGGAFVFLSPYKHGQKCPWSLTVCIKNARKTTTGFQWWKKVVKDILYSSSFHTTLCLKNDMVKISYWMFYPSLISVLPFCSASFSRSHHFHKKGHRYICVFSGERQAVISRWGANKHKTATCGLRWFFLNLPVGRSVPPLRPPSDVWSPPTKCQLRALLHTQVNITRWLTLARLHQLCVPTWTNFT